MWNRTSFLVGLAMVGLIACGGGAMQEPNVAEPPAPEAVAPEPAAEPAVPAESTEAAAEPDPQPEKIDVVDCKRIDDPDYRKQVEASGIDPDTIDCHEDDTGG